MKPDEINQLIKETLDDVYSVLTKISSNEDLHKAYLDSLIIIRSTKIVCKMGDEECNELKQTIRTKLSQMPFSFSVEIEKKSLDSIFNLNERQIPLAFSFVEENNLDSDSCHKLMVYAFALHYYTKQKLKEEYHVSELDTINKHLYDPTIQKIKLLAARESTSVKR